MKKIITAMALCMLWCTTAPAQTTNMANNIQQQENAGSRYYNGPGRQTDRMDRKADREARRADRIYRREHKHMPEDHDPRYPIDRSFPATTTPDSRMR